VTRRTARLLAVLALASAGCSALSGEAFQPTVSRPLIVDANLGVGQTFAPQSPAVAGVDLLVATFGTIPDPDGTLEVVLRAGVGGRIEAEAAIAGTRLRDNAWVPVRFDPPVPAPDLAVVEARWSGATPVGLYGNVPPAGREPDRLVNDPYPSGELLLHGNPAAGDLAFRAVGVGDAGSARRTVLRLGGGAARGLVAQPAFAFAWCALLVACLALFLVGRHRARELGRHVAEQHEHHDAEQHP
jgi:hypothetical protein